MSSSPPAQRGPVVTVSSNKGGVGKTTLATNLAIYTRALREDLPVLVVGLDDQGTLDRMFALRELRPGDGNLKHAWAERSLASAATAASMTKPSISGSSPCTFTTASQSRPAATSAIRSVPLG